MVFVLFVVCDYSSSSSSSSSYAFSSADASYEYVSLYRSAGYSSYSAPYASSFS